MTLPFFTIGHSTRSLDDFVGLLQAAEVQVLVDVRTIPRSRRNSQFNKDALPGSLQDVQIGYEHLIALGGRRGWQPGGALSPNTFWTHESFRNYADYAMGPEFRAALARLRELGHQRRCAIMCAEAVWWRCHRRIIADYLLNAGESVLHILGPDKVEAAELTPAARPQEDGAILYPAPAPDHTPSRLSLESGCEPPAGFSALPLLGSLRPCQESRCRLPQSTRTPPPRRACAPRSPPARAS